VCEHLGRSYGKGDREVGHEGQAESQAHHSNDAGEGAAATTEHHVLISIAVEQPHEAQHRADRGGNRVLGSIDRRGDRVPGEGRGADEAQRIECYGECDAIDEEIAQIIGH
jgi:hypothetical protein